MPAKKVGRKQAVAPQEFNSANAPEPKQAIGYAHEEPFQIETASYLDHALPRPGAFWFHVPNGGWRSITTARSLKRQGTKPGVPDNVIFWLGCAYLIELKSRTGVLKTSQKKVIPEIESAGAPVAVARTLEEVAAALTGWGIPLTMSPDEWRNRSRIVPTPTRMSVSEYKAVMGLDAAAKQKRNVSWQKKLTASRRPLFARVKPNA